VKRMRFPLLAILNANVMVVCQKTKDRRELLNLKSSINYGDDCVTSRRQKDKAHMM
jgi:hypothetical protein